MSDSSVPIIEPTIDYSKVPPIHQKRTISFVNHFVANAVSFLNKFALTCEDKLFEFEHKLQRVEAAVAILESRLASVPGLEDKSLVNESHVNADTVVVREPNAKDTDETDREEAIGDQKKS